MSKVYEPYKHRAFVADVAQGGGGVFSTPNPNSFVFKVRLQFCTELLWDKINILRQKESGSNQQ